MNEAEKKIIKNIDEYGCHVTTVFDPNGDDPTFCYSTGIMKTYGSPEIIVVGLSVDLGHSIVNNYAGRLKAGAKFGVGNFYPDFLGGFDVTFGEVSQSNKEKYMLSSCWFNGNEFDALQLIYPTTKGVWPWAKEATESFHAVQPSLAGNKAW
jgi:hypothetical protein